MINIAVNYLYDSSIASDAIAPAKDRSRAIRWGTGNCSLAQTSPSAWPLLRAMPGRRDQGRLKWAGVRAAVRLARTRTAFMRPRRNQAGTCAAAPSIVTRLKNSSGIFIDASLSVLLGTRAGALVPGTRTALTTSEDRDGTRSVPLEQLSLVNY
jgi:hypothetical protein